jgi:hypothetical protein
MAENMSSNICECCGTTNNVGRTNGWIYTICKDCYDTSDDRIHNMVWVENDHTMASEVSAELRKIKLDKLNSIKEI